MDLVDMESIRCCKYHPIDKEEVNYVKKILLDLCNYPGLNKYNEIFKIILYLWLKHPRGKYMRVYAMIYMNNLHGEQKIKWLDCKKKLDVYIHDLILRGGTNEEIIKFLIDNVVTSREQLEYVSGLKDSKRMIVRELRFIRIIEPEYQDINITKKVLINNIQLVNDIINLINVLFSKITIKDIKEELERFVDIIIL